MVTEACDYRMADAEAEYLRAVVLLPHGSRADLLTRYAVEHGHAAAINLFSQVIGMANSVIENNREMIELLGIIEGGEHPYRVEQYNLPTLVGALAGVPLANSIDQRKVCHSCAYRLGAPANQSPVTTIDAAYCSSDEITFLCHEDVDEKGNPTHLCRGHAQRMKSQLSSDPV